MCCDSAVARTVARTVARSDVPMRRGAHRDAQRARTDIQSRGVARKERAQESCCFCEDENKVVVFVETRTETDGSV